MVLEPELVPVLELELAPVLEEDPELVPMLELEVPEVEGPRFILFGTEVLELAVELLLEVLLLDVLLASPA